MKCAKEFIYVKQAAIAEKEAEERRQDLAAMEQYRQWCIDTIKFCDEYIDKALIEKAEKCETLLITLQGNISCDRLNNKYFRTDYIIDYGYSILPIDALTKYLEQHCLKYNINFSSTYNTYIKKGKVYKDYKDTITIYVPKETPCDK